jgi:CBS domain-containing protein
VLAKKPLDPHSVSIDATMLDALRVMIEWDIGAVLVLDGERPVGLFTERDFARHTVFDGSPAYLTPVRQVMAENVVFATPEQTVLQGMALMREQRLRYLLVLEDSHPLGMLSFGDLLEETIAYQERVLNAIELDRLVLFARGTYSC